ncbi:DNA-processing protein DprA [Pseudomonas azerbaijanorientalis]|uniref:DNA-processing protein DprA n=1 Tax=Pseudomonas azerbaijanorientalis TaxID=2842350 RepID=UPI001C3C7651|nr:DNA-processing protein DprA [Pseudomonas azerbaijanorientalis]QXH64262.1 DNA-protecting protein DprA [Pseudomonas azerbaijanorientalis]
MDDRGFWRHEKIAFLALTTLKGVGFRTLHKIAASDEGFNHTLRNPSASSLERVIRDAGFSDLEGQQRLWELGIEEARKLAAMGIVLLFNGEATFPRKLKEISDAPYWLFIQGSIENLKQSAASIVGTRKPSADGIFLTKYMVAALAKSKIVTVSGLAVGIDQTAHLESLRYGLPTVAVLGTGILENYPRGSEGLRAEIIAKGGTVLSEYLPCESYSSENFVRRNRLQAGLGDVLFPTEWKIKSGTAHTVKFAHKYGKKIVNLYLPATQEIRPELAFARDTYGAVSLEVPSETGLLLQMIAELSFTLLNGPREFSESQTPILKSESVSHEPISVSDDELINPDMPKTPQMPLF